MHRLLCSFVFVCALSLTSVVAAPPTISDKDLAAGVLAVLDRGADVYNSGNASGCALYFEGALRMLRPSLTHRPALQKNIDDGLASAARETDQKERAFILHRLLNQIRKDLRGAAPAATKVKSATPAPTPKTEVGFTLSKEERELLDLTNREREKAGLPALKPSEKLFRAAREHSANMVRHGRLAHELDGKGPSERIREIGYVFVAMGENCAAGQRTPAEAVRGWMNSPGHRSNLLGNNYQEVGLGVAGGDGGQRYWTQVFATPAPARR